MFSREDIMIIRLKDGVLNIFATGKEREAEIVEAIANSRLEVVEFHEGREHKEDDVDWAKARFKRVSIKLIPKRKKKS